MSDPPLPPPPPPSSAAPPGTAAATVALPTPTAFPFPFPQGPYPVQLALIQHVYRALEDGAVAVVQSPTGTGKSLSLLTAALQWLRDDLARRTTASLSTYAAELAARARPDDPPWLAASLLARRRKEVEEERRRADEELKRVRQEEASRAQRKEYGIEGGGGRKRAKLSHSTPDEDADDRFLPSASSDSGASAGPGEGREGLKEGEVWLSKEVRELMAQMNPTAPPPPAKDTIPTKIFFASRTHSQLSQVLGELRRTSFAASAGPAVEVGLEGGAAAAAAPADEDEQPAIRALALGSRKTLCVNPAVLAGPASTLDERCLDLASSATPCPYLPSRAEGGWEGERGRAFGRKVLSKVRDVEDLKALGEEEGCCSYYGARNVVDQAEFIALPYNLLLHAPARQSLGLDLSSSAVIIDEAHNLIDAVLALHSSSTSLSKLTLAKKQMEVYLGRFKARLGAENLVRVKQCVKVLGALVKSCERFAASGSALSPPPSEGNTSAPRPPQQSASQMLPVPALVASWGGSSDQVDLGSLARWLGEARMAVKVSGYAERCLEEEVRKNLSNDPARAARLSALKHSSISAFHAFTALVGCLAAAAGDGRVLFSFEDVPGEREGKKGREVKVKYLLLNPGEVFRDVVEGARSVVLAGGTMEPVSDFPLQLFPSLPSAKLQNFSCGHVIPRENLRTVVLCRGPKGRELEFKFAGRGDEGLLEELGATLSNAVNLVPDGLVVFCPSYAFLENIKSVWGKSGLLERIGARKTVFYEPQVGGSVDAVLAEYTAAILSPPPSSSTAPGAPRAARKTGAILFAVVGAKLSEGINFSDRLARAVVMVGLPFPNAHSPELSERMRHVVDVARAAGRPNAETAGRELYVNLCMKAVNQSIGRAIRHANDYAVLILVDKRYAQPSIRAKLPGWITGAVADAGGAALQGEGVQVCQTFGEGVRQLAGFFKGRREAATAASGVGR